MQPGNSLMYPFVATWFARCADLDGVDLSFMKIITVGGGVLDPTTAELLKKKIPHIKIVRVSKILIFAPQTIFFLLLNMEGLRNV